MSPAQLLYLVLTLPSSYCIFSYVSCTFIVSYVISVSFIASCPISSVQLFHPVLSLPFIYCILSYLSCSFIASCLISLPHLLHPVSSLCYSILFCLIHFCTLYYLACSFTVSCLISAAQLFFPVLSLMFIHCILPSLSLPLFFLPSLPRPHTLPFIVSHLISPSHLSHPFLSLFFSSLLSYLSHSVILSCLISPVQLLHPVFSFSLHLIHYILKKDIHKKEIRISPLQLLPLVLSLLLLFHPVVPFRSVVASCLMSSDQLVHPVLSLLLFKASPDFRLSLFYSFKEK